MTVEEFELNPIYATMMKAVNAAMNEANLTNVSQCQDLVPSFRLRNAMALPGPLSNKDPYQPTWHELMTLRAADLLINGRKKRFLEYSSALSRKVDPMQSESFDQLCKYASRYPVTLRWTMLLHDIAKDRYPRVKGESDEESKKKAHPELCAKCAETVFGSLNWDDLSDSLGEYNLGGDLETQNTILWLIKNHDMLGNMFTGERAPNALKESLDKIHDEAEKEHRLNMLQVVTLCDLWGTADGRYLTEQKVRHWLSFSDFVSIDEKQKNLLDWRIRRWTGDSDGIDNPNAAAKFKESIEKGNSEGVILLLEKTDLVAYGFYLFTELKPEDLADVLSQITQDKTVKKLIEDQECMSISLMFDKYKSSDESTQHVLDAYRERSFRCEPVEGDNIAESKTFKIKTVEKQLKKEENANE